MNCLQGGGWLYLKVSLVYLHFPLSYSRHFCFLAGGVPDRAGEFDLDLPLPLPLPLPFSSELPLRFSFPSVALPFVPVAALAFCPSCHSLCWSHVSTRIPCPAPLGSSHSPPRFALVDRVFDKPRCHTSSALRAFPSLAPELQPISQSRLLGPSAQSLLR